MRKSICFITLSFGILLASCNSIDSQISKYEKACVAGNFTKAAKIANKLEKESDKITDEQAVKISEAAMKCSETTIKKYEDMDDEY